MDGFLHVLDLATGEGLARFRTAGADLISGQYGFDRRSIQSTPALTAEGAYVGQALSRVGKGGRVVVTAIGHPTETKVEMSLFYLVTEQELLWCKKQKFLIQRSQEVGNSFFCSLK